MKKALALFSGGCDSLIAMKLLKDQGIEVIALHFNIGFGGNKDKLEYFKNATAQIPVELKIPINFIGKFPPRTPDNKKDPYAEISLSGGISIQSNVHLDIKLNKSQRRSMNSYCAL